MTIELRHVEFMPKVLEPNVLYVSEKYRTAAHLCACGCGDKIRTPLGPTEWSFTTGRRGPSLWPSVGSWQRPCRSHYVIRNGEVHWANQWTDSEVRQGRLKEHAARKEYFAKRAPKSRVRRLWTWLKALFVIR
ncbi:MAG: hypothetical protein KDE25_01240 [Novosphingobium sp.]|nr:hypothetical protein [Novosphingobium sp.]